MPGENLHKLSKIELKELRDIVRKVYGEREGLTREQTKEIWTNRECDKLIDSLLPSTVDELKRIGVESKFVKKKKFFMPSRLVGLNGKAIMREDG